MISPAARKVKKRARRRPPASVFIPPPVFADPPAPLHVAPVYMLPVRTSRPPRAQLRLRFARTPFPPTVRAECKPETRCSHARTRRRGPKMVPPVYAPPACAAARFLRATCPPASSVPTTTPSAAASRPFRPADGKRARRHVPVFPRRPQPCRQVAPLSPPSVPALRRARAAEKPRPPP